MVVERVRKRHEVEHRQSTGEERRRTRCSRHHEQASLSKRCLRDAPRLIGRPGHQLRAKMHEASKPGGWKMRHDIVSVDVAMKPLTELGSPFARKVRI